MREQVLNGATAFQFDQALFDSRSNLPVFAYAVTATFAGTDGTVAAYFRSEGLSEPVSARRSRKIQLRLARVSSLFASSM